MATVYRSYKSDENWLGKSKADMSLLQTIYFVYMPLRFFAYVKTWVEMAIFSDYQTGLLNYKNAQIWTHAIFSPLQGLYEKPPDARKRTR